jgi:hypothetical protein
MKKRIKMQCWNCERVFSLLKELHVDEKPRLLVECPFCEQEAVVDLAPFRTEKVEHYKSGDTSEGAAGLALPEVLPTRKPED